MDGESAEQAKDRLRAAGERANELRDRLAELEAGRPVGVPDVTRAREAADEALRLGAMAHDRAAAAHESAADAHRSAAELAETAGHLRRAAEHRRSALDDEAAAEVDRVAAEADRGRRRPPEPSPA